MTTTNNQIQIKILGTQSPYCKENSAGPSYLIIYKNTKILLDCGSGSHRFFDCNNLDNLHILISHLHYDHFVDLYTYMYSAYAFKNLNKINKPIEVYIPTYPSSIYSEIKNINENFCNFNDIEEYKKYNINGIDIDFCKVQHANFVDNYAIRLKVDGKTIVYSGDASFSAQPYLTKFVKDADLFICEASLLKEHNFPEICNHLTASQGATIAKEANVKKLIITHFWPEEKTEKYLLEAKAVFKNTFIAKEKDIYTI